MPNMSENWKFSSDVAHYYSSWVKKILMMLGQKFKLNKLLTLFQQFGFAENCLRSSELKEIIQQYHWNGDSFLQLELEYSANKNKMKKKMRNKTNSILMRLNFDVPKHSKKVLEIHISLISSQQ